MSPTALTIALARVLNAPHCLQASIVTTFFPPTEALVVGAGLFFSFFVLATGVVVVETFFLTTVDLALTGAASSFLVTAAALRVPAMMSVADYCDDDDGCVAEQIIVAAVLLTTLPKHRQIPPQFISWMLSFVCYGRCRKQEPKPVRGRTLGALPMTIDTVYMYTVGGNRLSKYMDSELRRLFDSHAYAPLTLGI